MPLAAFEVVYLIPLTALMIPIVAILTYHQRKMAEVIHAHRQPSPPSPEIEALRREVLELKQVVHQQTIAIDGIRQLPQPTHSGRLEVQ
jgi:hypothetical protein